jgi:pilus assembly protein CpaB
MRMKSLILIFIALGCGLVASIGISQVMNRDGGGAGMEMEQILVALADIDIGTKLDAQNVRLEEWPKVKVPEGAVRKLEDVKDKFANARFFKGEPLHVSKISDTLTNIATKVPAGYRAMPVKVEEDTVMKGISPGDRVDVMVFVKRGPDIPETGAFTILKNVRVFAINTNTERATDAKGEAANFKTISLLVKPEHARELVIAGSMGKIMLTLRRPDETDELAGEEVTPLAEILSGRSKVASDPVASSTPSSPANGFLPFVQGAVSTTNNGGQTGPSPTAEPVWKMELLTPAERKVYEWSDLKHLPVETVVTGSAGGASVAPTPAPAVAPPVSGPGGDAPPVKGPSAGDDAAPPSRIK